jgi:hypothetical protein
MRCGTFFEIDLKDFCAVILVDTDADGLGCAAAVIP